MTEIIIAGKVGHHHDMGGSGFKGTIMRRDGAYKYRTIDMDMRDHIADRTSLAHTYACDGAYHTAARILAQLAIELRIHANTLPFGQPQPIHPTPVWVENEASDYIDICADLFVDPETTDGSNDLSVRFSFFETETPYAVLIIGDDSVEIPLTPEQMALTRPRLDAAIAAFKVIQPPLPAPRNQTMSRYPTPVPMDTLLGLTFVSVTRGEFTVGYNSNDGIELITDTGQRFWLIHEHVTVEDIVGDLFDLQGSPILRAEERSQDDPNADESGTIKGSVTIRFYGSSNGYYGESASLYTIQKED